MKNFIFAAVVLACGTGLSSAQENNRIEELLNQMTLEEKIGQMTQLNITTINGGGGHDQVQLNRQTALEWITEHHIGSFLNGEAVPPEEWYAFINELMEISVEESRLGIPVIYGVDHMHGASYVGGATIFPHNINLGATFNDQHSINNAIITGLESADLGHHWNFAPVLDLGRNPLWPRIYETFGEDPYLAGRMGAAYVNALENHPDIAPFKQATTGKHYLGYSDPKAGWDRTPAHIPDQEIYEFFGAPFRDAIAAGLSTIMVNSSEVNGVPVHASRWILTDLLRDYYGFEGVVITDWADIQKLYNYHYIAEDMKEATRMAVEAGIDMSMTPYDLSFNEALLELVQEGIISEERIDQSVRRILALKFKLGLFGNPYPRNDRFERIGAEEHKQKAYEAAVESIVLLKNKSQVLPLSQEIKKILIVGPSADSKRNLSGGWTISWQGGAEERFPEDVETIFTAMKNAFPDAEVSAVSDLSNIRSIVDSAGKADAIIYTFGETPYTEDVGNISSLDLPREQMEVIEATSEVEAAKILVMVEGRPRIITDIVEKVDGVFWAGLPGNEGGKAIANLIAGKEVPSGKLSVSYPKYPGTFFPYNHKPSVFKPDLLNEDDEPNTLANMHVETTLYPFGYGLSYTTFEYSDLKISADKIDRESSVTASITVKNTGSIAGKESVLWFVTDLVGSITRPVKELQQYEKIALEPGESATLTFEITPLHNLSYPDEEGNIRLENGTFIVSVGNQALPFQLTD